MLGKLWSLPIQVQTINVTRHSVQKTEWKQHGCKDGETDGHDQSYYIPTNAVDTKSHSKVPTSTYPNFAGFFCSMAQEMTLLEPELYADESALDTFGVVAVDREAGFDSGQCDHQTIQPFYI